MCIFTCGFCDSKNSEALPGPPQISKMESFATTNNATMQTHHAVNYCYKPYHLRNLWGTLDAPL